MEEPLARSSFFPAFEQLPRTLPIFPLEGVVVMPEAELPLNIFEPRYLHMVEDALAIHRMIGMVQPLTGSTREPLPVYSIGSAGRITAYRETDDGRILLTLTGVCRFDIREELASIRGYRRVVPDWNRFRGDYDEDTGDQPLVDQARFFRALARFLKARDLEADVRALQQLPLGPLVSRLATVLPLDPAEKQALVEAVEARARAQALLAALELSIEDASGAGRH
jgi:Lon protease-like protein